MKPKIFIAQPVWRKATSIAFSGSPKSASIQASCTDVWSAVAELREAMANVVVDNVAAILEGRSPPDCCIPEICEIRI